MEATVENVETTGIPAQQFTVIQPEGLDFVGDKVLENENIQTQISYMETQNYNSTDLHDEINRKLEEIANLDNAEELNKSDELICESSFSQMSVVSQPNDAVSPPTDPVAATSDTDAPPSATCEEQPETESNEKQQEMEVVALETNENDIAMSTSQMETNTEQSEGEPTEGATDQVSAITDDKQDELDVKPVEKSTEPTVDPVKLVEDQLKDLVGCESDAANESAESVDVADPDCKVESPEDQVQEREETETLILESEQIEISEIDASEVIESEELQLEYTVVDECDASTQDSTSVSTEPTVSQDDSTATEDQSTEVKPAVAENSEQVVYIEEIEETQTTVVSESVVSDTGPSPEAEENELFIVTVESPDIDPLKQAQSVKPKKPRGRKPTFAIPSHVLGIDINHPSGNLTGRLKPRLGVKVPYMNLSSQIVSKKEIEDEIMERFRQKQAQQAAERNDIMFARKLTQRLASKIVPEAGAITTIALAQTMAKPQPTPTTTVKLPASSVRIEKDSDLLAILEGDDDDLHQPDEETLKKEREEAEKKVKMLEREIALKQLRDLPNTPAVVIKPARSKTETKLNSENSKPSKTSGSSSHSSASSQSVKAKPKTDSSHSKKVDVVPHLKPAMILKTYSRKRKSIDLESILSAKKPTTSEGKSDSKASEGAHVEKTAEQKPDKKAAVTTEQKSEKKTSNPVEQKPETITPTHPYVTKSSRVIKKKVIWDPDEVVTPRALIKSPKPGDTPGIPKQATPASKTIEKKPSSDKTSEKKIQMVEKKIATDKTEKKVLHEKKTIEKKQLIEKSERVEKKTPKKSISPKKGKRLSEIDRLLMDEGAVNMLYEVKNTEDAQSKMKKKAKTVISIEKAEKELRNKASELLKDLKQNTTTEDVHKTLRRKDSPPEPKKELLPAVIVRKMSKDSSKSSVHSPPASPAFPYEASRIIRRHSSSSFSSGEEGALDSGEKISKKRSAPAGSLPKSKKIKKVVESPAVTPTVKVVKDNFVCPKEAVSIPVPKQKEPAGETKAPTPKITVIKKTEKIVTLKLNNGEGEAFLSVQVLKEMIANLNRLAKDSNCHGVVITSGGNSYCLGLNYKFLVADTEDARKKKATELANQVRDFLKCLLHFPKVLIAGVQGDCIGLGVTMLSLFDMVVASDKAQFSMPYGTFGCVPEAAFLLTVPHLVSHGLASELFYTSSKLSASEVARHGLVTRLCWPEKYSDELKTVSSNISQQNLQSIQAAKKQLRQSLIESTEAAITSQTKTLIEHWISDECQNNFANFKMETK